MAKNEYGLTIGRGEIYFGRYKPGQKAPEGMRYCGVSSALSASMDGDSQDYMSKEGGVDETALSVQMSVTRSGSLTTEAVNDDNLAFFFMGEAAKVTVEPVEDATHTIEGAEPGLSYQIGTSFDNPVGVRNIHSVSATANNGTALEEGTDFEVNLETGFFTILGGTGNVSAGDTVTVTYSTDGYTQTRVLSGNETIYVSLRYIAENITGQDRHYFMPLVKITPSGEYALKGDEWMAMTFDITILKPRGGMEAVYIDGHPLAA